LYPKTIGMLDLLLTGSVAFIITFLAVPVIIQIAKLKKLYDLPDERKVHTHPIPSLGGIGIFGGFTLAALLSIPIYLHPEFQYFFAAAFVIFFLGLKDDVLILSATKKFIGQVIAASILIHLGGLKITSMHGLLGFEDVPEAVSIALSYVTIIVVINSFNLIDGVDGLASVLGLITMLVFGSYFYYIGLQAYSLLAFAMAGSLIGFLIFNYHPAKIFMGDSGSLMVGLVNSILVIKFISSADASAIAFPVASSVAVGFAILIVPLLDTLRVFSIRILDGRSPFSPDRNHFHHLLLDRGLSHNSITLCCGGINVVFIAIAFLGRNLGSNLLMMIMLAIAFTSLGCLYVKKAKVKPMVAKPVTSKSFVSEEFKTAHQVVSLKPESTVLEER
jgi:UDP-N-acetylmuramyl pentapeptide phosphotransferase/UDP-N-acetylglucosamine-1-phosphate transferase